MADNSVEVELAEACLAHAVGNAGVQACQRGSMLERRRPGLGVVPDRGGRGVQDRRSQRQAEALMIKIAITAAASSGTELRRAGA
jgi:hypothetical protein